MRIIADENMPLVSELFSPYGEIILKPGRQIVANDLADVDALLIRSVTQVRSELLQSTKLRFIGSATIGADHVDLNAIKNKGIQFANAPGCNANAVAEYVIACLSVWQEQSAFDFGRDVVAVIGYGNVGKTLVKKLLALNVPVLVHDPVLLATGFTDDSVRFVSKEEALQAKVLSLHMPLNQEGEFATKHWLSNREFTSGTFTHLINSCRGAVVNNVALKKWLENTKHHAVLDVWENEPKIDTDLLKQVDLATPHIAGYSLEGKTNGSFTVFNAFCKHFNLSGQHASQYQLTEPNSCELDLYRIKASLLQCLREFYDPTVDDASMRKAIASATDISLAFDRLRKEYPVRRELASARLSNPRKEFEPFAPFFAT